MTKEPIDDIDNWSKSLPLWRQDALRRLAIGNDLVGAVQLDAVLGREGHV